MQLHGHKICIFTSDMQGLIWGEPELCTYFCDVKQNHVSHECGVVLKVKGNQLPLADLTYMQWCSCKTCGHLQQCLYVLSGDTRQAQFWQFKLGPRVASTERLPWWPWGAFVASVRGHWSVQSLWCSILANLLLFFACSYCRCPSCQWVFNCSVQCKLAHCASVNLQ